MYTQALKMLSSNIVYIKLSINMKPQYRNLMVKIVPNAKLTNKLRIIVG